MRRDRPLWYTGGMESQPLSFARKFSLWFFRAPFSPYVSLSVSVDFSVPGDYLRRINALDGPRVSLQHLVTGAVGRVYAEFPVANATAAAGRIVRHPHVGAGMPVNLLDGPTKGAETSVILVERVEQCSLREIAEATRRHVRSEREGNQANRVVRGLSRMAGRVPYPVLGGALGAIDRATRVPWLARRMHAGFPLTVVVSNPGAALPLPDGARMLGAAFSPPQRLLGVGSVVGVFPLQDEVVPVDGKPEVRTMLPLLYVFDHRLFDGVLAGRILTRLFEVLQAPDVHFGADGHGV